MKTRDNTEEWKAFVEQQKSIILHRIAKYSNKNRWKTDIIESGNPTNYHIYKNSSVLPYLNKALEHIERGTYGMFTVCNADIPLGRLKLVPGALACVKCDDKKQKVNE